MMAVAETWLPLPCQIFKLGHWPAIYNFLLPFVSNTEWQGLMQYDMESFEVDLNLKWKMKW